MIADALQASRLLQQHSIIYKITGRIFLKNSQKIFSTYKKHRNEFIVYHNKRWCFTNIFKFSKEDYIWTFFDIYKECDEASGCDIERMFFKRLEQTKLDIGSFSAYPYFDGIQGATLEAYSDGFLKRKIRDIMCFLKMFTYGSVTSKLLYF